MVTNNAIMSSIRSDSALADILSKFDSNYILDVVRDSIGMRFRPYESPLPSLNSIESSFQSILSSVEPSMVQHVLEVREKTYEEIINEVCGYYGLEFNRDYNTDIYSSAYWIYDFLVCNFTNYFTNFLLNYIIRNKSELYNYLGLDNLKKDKDSANVYSRKITPDPQLAMIHANLGTVLDNIFVFDITFNDIINFSLNDNMEIKTFITNILKDINGTVFKDKYVPIYNSPYRVDIITSIKLSIQNYVIQNTEISKQV